MELQTKTVEVLENLHKNKTEALNFAAACDAAIKAFKTQAQDTPAKSQPEATKRPYKRRRNKGFRGPKAGSRAWYAWQVLKAAKEPLSSSDLAILVDVSSGRKYPASIDDGGHHLASDLCYHVRRNRVFVRTAPSVYGLKSYDAEPEVRVHMHDVEKYTRKGITDGGGTLESELSRSGLSS